MSIERTEVTEARLVEETPVEQPSSALAWLLRDLRRGWAAYRLENKRGWDRLVEEQARNPALD